MEQVEVRGNEGEGGGVALGWDEADRLLFGAKPRQGGVGVAHRQPRLRYTHEAMADMILMQPGISQEALGAAFGYKGGWVSVVVNSDAFQALLARRRAELIDPEITITLQERVRALTTQSLKVLQDKISRPADQVSDVLALRAFELGAKSLGMGGNAAPPPPPDPAQYLPALADRLMRLQGRTSPVAEVIDMPASIPSQEP